MARLRLNDNGIRRRLAAIALALMAATAAVAQSEAPFDPATAREQVAEFSAALGVADVPRRELEQQRQQVVAWRGLAERCVDDLEPRIQSLKEQLELYEGIDDMAVAEEIFDLIADVRRELEATTARHGYCTRLSDEADDFLAVVEDAQSEISSEFLWQRSDDVAAIAMTLPARVAAWPALVRGSVELQTVSGLSGTVLLGVLILVGAAAAFVGLMIRRRFRSWFAAGNPAGSRPRLKYLLPKPLAHYAPLLLEGLALTLVLKLSIVGASQEDVIVRLAASLALYGLGCVLIEWATGPLSPSANVTGLIPDHVVPLRRRLKLLILVLVAHYVVTGHAQSASPMGPDVAPLIQLLLLGATAAALFGVFTYLGRIPGMQGRFRFIRFAGILATLVGVGALFLGYQNFAAYMINGVVQTSLALILLWILLWLTLTGFEALSEQETPLAEQIGSVVGLKKDEPNSALGFMQLVADVVLWGLFVIFVIGVWDTAGTTLQRLDTIVSEGATVGNVELVPLLLLYGILGFAALVILTGWIRRWVDRRWFRHLGMDRGGRDALGTLLGYVGVVIAFLLGLNLAGIDLTGLAFVAGALAVGIGFGLQAITSNFVSGLILLLERPIKAGDFVTVGDIEGFIRQIRIRATEIETLNDQNVLVPNSELVSGRVTNWVLRDPRGRLVLNVGVAYGSDIERVRDILVDVAGDHSEVVTDGTAPAPRALFMNFGDSSLDFELRVRIKRIERRYTVQSDLNFAIDAAFRREGITIPFPQRDLHLISTPEQPAVEPVETAPKKPPPRPRAEQVTRKQRHTVEVDASLERVWTALTDSDLAERWLAPDVEISPRIGGDVRLTLENDIEIVGRIDRFMPPRRLRIVLQPEAGDEPLASGPITEEYELESGEDAVNVTVIVRGIPATEDWEHYYRQTEDRWTRALADLKRAISDGSHSAD